MKTSPKIFFTLTVALMCLCTSANAQTLIAGFESDVGGFTASNMGSVALGPAGATEGTSALQFTAESGFQFLTSFSFFGDLTNPENDTILFDVTFTPDDPAATTFSQVDFGINSNGANSPDNGFQFTSETAGIDQFPIAEGVTTPIELSFGDLPEFPLNGSETFAGLLLITNSDGAGVWSIDNVRLNTAAVVPEPSSLACLGVLGFLGLVKRRRS